MKNKKIRIEAVKEVLLTEQVSSQDEMLQLLSEKGFDITQATLSRDLKMLRVFKTQTDTGEYIYKLPDNNVKKLPADGFFAKSFLSLHFSGNIAVLKTRSGYASGVAAEIDEKMPAETLGTVAGDDTIIVVMRENVSQEQFKSRLASFLPM